LYIPLINKDNKDGQATYSSEKYIHSFYLGFAVSYQNLPVCQPWHYIAHYLDWLHVMTSGHRKLLKHLQWWSMG